MKNAKKAFAKLMAFIQSNGAQTPKADRSSFRYQRWIVRQHILEEARAAAKIEASLQNSMTVSQP